jgi:hypothetical protein
MKDRDINVPIHTPKKLTGNPALGPQEKKKDSKDNAPELQP